MAEQLDGEPLQNSPTHSGCVRRSRVRKHLASAPGRRCLPPTTQKTPAPADLPARVLAFSVGAPGATRTRGPVRATAQETTVPVRNVSLARGEAGGWTIAPIFGTATWDRRCLSCRRSKWRASLTSLASASASVRPGPRTEFRPSASHLTPLDPPLSPGWGMGAATEGAALAELPLLSPPSTDSQLARAC